MLKTDGLQIGDHKISVAISNPPQRKQPLSMSQQFPSLGGGKKETEAYVVADSCPTLCSLHCLCASLGAATGDDL